MDLNDVFSKLWNDYAAHNPSVKKIHELFESRGEKITNDHIAFRTFNDQRISIDKLARIFIDAGYKVAGEYRFEKKKLKARHFEHQTDKSAPRVFISELLLEEFSFELQTLIKSVLDAIPEEKMNPQTLIFDKNIFGIPSYQIYEKLRNESEYAAWVYAFGFRANHFTVSVNSLKTLNGIEEVNEMLKNEGFALNSSGGEIKGSIDLKLKQSSTLADVVSHQFDTGIKQIPSCYYEFAERFPGDNGDIFSGFIADSADKIFESTDFR